MMASEIHMPGPVCLIENVKGQLTANQEALDILSAIQHPVVVVTIVGPYLTGKSYLMNKLAGKNTGFSLGSTVQSHTEGIWMWCVPHPRKPDHTLVLLDTEGLGDVEKASEVYQNFLKSQIPTEESILPQAKKEAAEKELEIERQKQKEKQEEMEDLKRSFSENMSQLQKKLEKDIQSLLMGQEKVLDLKMKILEKRVQEGFHRYLDEMKLIEEKHQTSKQDLLSKLCEEIIAVFRDTAVKLLYSNTKKFGRRLNLHQ